MTKPSERLKELGITLPPVPKPVASYVPWLRHGDLLFISGQLPVKEGKIAYQGKVGFEQRLEVAQEAARVSALNSIAAAAEAAGGIDNLARVLKVVVYVASHESFTEQHLVANGASDLLKDIFGEAGVHTRAAIGVAALPMNSMLEIDITFALK